MQIMTSSQRSKGPRTNYWNENLPISS